MDNTKLSDLVKSAVKVNLNYSASLLTLSKDYIKAMSDALTNPSAQQPDGDNTTPARIPLIIAGRAGEIANATFAVHNTSGVRGSISLQIQGEFEGIELSVDPATLDMEIGANELVRILATITTKTPIDKDMSGVVIIPELGLRVAEFVVRRLADKPVSVKKTDAKKSATK
jgi:hypothetical protein